MDIADKINEIDYIRDEIESGQSCLPEETLMNYAKALTELLIDIKEQRKYQGNENNINELTECILDALVTLSTFYIGEKFNWDSVINMDDKYTDEEAKYILQMVIASKNPSYNTFIMNCKARKNKELFENIKLAGWC